MTNLLELSDRAEMPFNYKLSSLNFIMPEKS